MAADNIIWPTTPEGWRDLIQDQFGSQALIDFEKQKTLVEGYQSEEAYYQFLVSDFTETIEEFLKFSTIYLDGKAAWGPRGKTLKESTEVFASIEPILKAWSLSDEKTKYETMKKCHENYRVLIDFLAEQKVMYDFDVSNLMFAIEHGFDRVALSLIKSKKVDLNFRSEHNYTALALATLQSNLKIVRALVESPGIELYQKLNGEPEQQKLVLEYASNKEVIGILLYHMLKITNADAASMILRCRGGSQFSQQDVYNHIMTLVKEAMDDNVKANILYNAVAIVDGQFPSALSYYLHTIKSPSGVVSKINLELKLLKNENSNLVLTVDQPKIGLKDICAISTEDNIDTGDYFELETMEEMEWEEKQKEELANKAQQQSTSTIPITPNSDEPETENLMRAAGKYTLGSLSVGTLLGVTAALTLALAFDVAPIYPFVGFVAAVVSVFVLALSAHMLYMKQYHPEALLVPIENMTPQYESQNSSAQNSFELTSLSQANQASSLLPTSERPNSYTRFWRAAVSSVISPEVPVKRRALDI